MTIHSTGRPFRRFCFLHSCRLWDDLNCALAFHSTGRLFRHFCSFHRCRLRYDFKCALAFHIISFFRIFRRILRISILCGFFRIFRRILSISLLCGFFHGFFGFFLYGFFCRLCGLLHGLLRHFCISLFFSIFRCLCGLLYGFFRIFLYGIFLGCGLIVLCGLCLFYNLLSLLCDFFRDISDLLFGVIGLISFLCGLFFLVHSSLIIGLFIISLIFCSRLIFRRCRLYLSGCLLRFRIRTACR